MDPEFVNIFGQETSVEEFDIDFEFDAPRFYDFSKPELDYSETELWFESAGNYPPSPFSLNWNPRFDEKHLEITKPISDKYNGFIYYDKLGKDVSKTTKKSRTKPFLRKNSTLTRPTASLLARQNKPLDIYSVQLLTRCHRSLGKFDDKVSSMPHTQDAKRQKLETGFLRKLSRLDHTPFIHKVPTKGSKVTVPKEPNLITAQRAAKNRFKANSAPEQIAQFSTTSLPKKNPPRPQNLQRFQLRTSLKTRDQPSSDKKTPTDDSKQSLRSNSISSKKDRKAKESLSSKTNCRVYESKISPPRPCLNSDTDSVTETTRLVASLSLSCISST